MKSLFVSHDLNARNDNKIIKLRMAHGWQGYGLFWGVVEMLAESSDYQLPLDYKALSFGLQTEEKVIKNIIENFGLFVIKDEIFYSKTLKQRMKYKDLEHKKKSEGGKKGNKIRWKKENSQNARENERLKNVYGAEVEQDTIRNQVNKYEV